MRCRKVQKLRRQFEQLRLRSLSRRDLESFAKVLGRRHAGGKKEPAYVNPEAPHLPPVTIPKHTVIKRGTGLSILNALAADLDWLEETCEEEDEDNVED